MDEQKIQVEPQGTDEQEPKQEKKKLSKKKRIVIGVIMIAIAVGALILGIMIQAKGFDLFTGENTTSVTNVAEASSNSAKTASTDIPQGKNLFNVYGSDIRPSKAFEISNFEYISTANTWNSYLPGVFVNLEVGKTYTVSFLAKANKPFDLRVRILDISSEIIDGLTLLSSVDTNYQYYTYTFKIRESKKYYLCFGYGDNSIRDGITYYKDIQLEEGSTATAYEPNYDALIAYGSINNSYNPLKKGDVIQDLYLNFDKPVLDISKIFPNYTSLNSAPMDNFKYFALGALQTVRTHGYKLKLFNNAVNDVILNYWINTNFDTNPKVFTIDIIICGKQYIDYFGFNGITNWNGSKTVFLPYNEYGETYPDLPIFQEDNIHFTEPVTLQADIPIAQQMCQDGVGVWLSKNRNFYLDEDGIFNGGYNNGYQDGNEQGYHDGYNNGYKQAENDYQKLDNLFFSIFDAPFSVFRDAFNFEIFGINVSALILFFITILCFGFVIKKLI